MKASEKQVNVISRDVIKRTGLVLYEVLSSNGVDKHYVTIKGNEVFCTCEGFNGKYHKCYHTRELVAAECELVAEAKMTAYLNCYDAIAEEKTASIEAVRQTGLAESYNPAWYRR